MKHTPHAFERIDVDLGYDSEVHTQDTSGKWKHVSDLYEQKHCMTLISIQA